MDGKRFRLAPMWPEWSEAELISEPWDIGNPKRKDTTTGRARADTKMNITLGPHSFEDPEGKVELPSPLKVEQWKRPIDFLTSEKAPVIVDPEFGTHNFDLITSNEHLHHSETMRHIICQLTALWDICRKERKSNNSSSESTNESNTIERTWRPWEHIYALTKTAKQSAIAPYNPAGKYAIRLFFLGTWRKIIVDDTIPFDSKNRCLLPQTTLSHELWPMLLTKALLKIISLDCNPSHDSLEYHETSIIHSLTGWIPEMIPLKYTHAEKVWDFLRYDRSNELHSTSSSAPLPLFKWPNPKVDTPEEKAVVTSNDPPEQLDENIVKKLDEKNSKKVSIAVPKDAAVIKPTNNKENRTGGPGPAVNNPKETKKTGGTSRLAPSDDSPNTTDDMSISDAPKLIIFAAISHLEPTRLSSFSETADRSERLRQYNLNEAFSTPILLTSVRDIPLEPPPPPPEPLPAWKLIRPRKPKVFPHAEPLDSPEPKSERWIEITSPYINYPAANTLHIKPMFRVHPPSHLTHPIDVTLLPKRRTKRPNTADPSNILEIDENEENQSDFTNEFVRSVTSISLPAPTKELSMAEESSRSAGSKQKLPISTERTKNHRKSVVSNSKLLSDTASMRSKGGENEQVIIPNDVQNSGNNFEQHTSQTSSQWRKSYTVPKIWMNFDDFCTCFTSVIVFHNPRGYQYSRKHTEIKFVPYQSPVLTPTVKEKRRDTGQSVIQPIPDDKASLYLFIESTRETLEKSMELMVSFTCLPRWYDTTQNEPVISNEKTVRGASIAHEKPSIDLHLTKNIVSQKDVLPQVGSLIAELYSWKSLSIGQPILRLHTTATKAALLTLPPGRHVVKFTNTCTFAFNLQVLSDGNDFILSDEEQLLDRIASVPEDVEFSIQAVDLFQTLDDAVQNFHTIDEHENQIHHLLRTYRDRAPESTQLTLQSCSNAFNQALYSTIRSVLNSSGTAINADTQFAWRCFTNDLSTPDILGAHEVKRPNPASASRHSSRLGGNSAGIGGGTSTMNKRTGGARERSSEDKGNQKQHPSLTHSASLSESHEEIVSEWLTRELSNTEVSAITNIQKTARGFLQRRIAVARKAGTEKNAHIQRMLQSTMFSLKVDPHRSALLFFKNFISFQPQLIQCFSFRDDDWNMVTYRDYNGIYSEQASKAWFILCREIFYVSEECLILAKFASHVPDSILRVINNDTCVEMPLVFNRLVPAMFKKNKCGYTFVAEGLSHDQTIPAGRFRLRLITAYAHLPETRTDQMTSSFFTKEIVEYYLPNKEQIICRYRAIFADDLHQTGRNYHVASLRFSTSKPDVYMRLTVLDNNEEIASIEGNGPLNLPAVLFMRSVSNAIQTVPSTRARATTFGGGRKKDTTNARRGSTTDTIYTQLERDRTGSGKLSRPSTRNGLTTVEEEEKVHKYIIQVTLLRKSWPLTATQWQFVDQLKEQEKSDLRCSSRQPSPTKTDGSRSGSASSRKSAPTNASTTSGKAKGGKSSSSSVSRPSTGKSSTEKSIDTSKPHWILQVVCDADKADELTIQKDTEKNDELMNTKKAWETLQVGRAEKAMRTRQRFLDSLQVKTEENPSSDITDETTNLSDTQTEEDLTNTITSPMKKLSTKDEILKPIETSSILPPTDDPLLNEPPPAKPKLILPPLDITPFIKRKSISNEPLLFDSVLEQEELQNRCRTFIEHSKVLNEIRDNRAEALNDCQREKVRQLEEYIDLQAKVDQTRRTMNEPREAFRQRFLEIERKRRAETVAREQRLLEEERTKLKTSKKKTSTGKKKKK